MVLQVQKNMLMQMNQAQTDQDHILMPIWNDSSEFDSSSKNDDPPSFSNAEKQDDASVNNASEVDNQNKESPESSTNGVSTTQPKDCTCGPNLNTVDPTINSAPQSNLFDEFEVELNNMRPTYEIPSTPQTTVHKYHPLGNVIGDVQSGVKTRRHTQNSDPQGFLNVVYEEKDHEEKNTFLFVCFLS